EHRVLGIGEARLDEGEVLGGGDPVLLLEALDAALVVLLGRDGVIDLAGAASAAAGGQEGEEQNEQQCAVHEEIAEAADDIGLARPGGQPAGRTGRGRDRLPDRSTVSDILARPCARPALTPAPPSPPWHPPPWRSPPAPEPAAPSSRSSRPPSRAPRRSWPARCARTTGVAAARAMTTPAARSSRGSSGSRSAWARRTIRCGRRWTAWCCSRAASGPTPASTSISSRAITRSPSAARGTAA